MARHAEGKYAKVLPKLQPLPPQDASYQEKVDEAKRKVIGEDREPTAMAERYAILRRGLGPPLDTPEAVKLITRLGREGLKALSSQCELWIKAYEQLLAESQEAKEEAWGRFGMKENALRLPSGETVRIQKEPYAKVVDKETFRVWCIANGYESQLQLWPSTTAAIVKERLLLGEPEPDGTQAFSYTEVQFVKSPEE